MLLKYVPEYWKSRLKEFKIFSGEHAALTLPEGRVSFASRHT